MKPRVVKLPEQFQKTRTLKAVVQGFIHRLSEVPIAFQMKIVALPEFVAQLKNINVDKKQFYAIVHSSAKIHPKSLIFAMKIIADHYKEM